MKSHFKIIVIIFTFLIYFDSISQQVYEGNYTSSTLPTFNLSENGDNIFVTKDNNNSFYLAKMDKAQRLVFYKKIIATNFNFIGIPKVLTNSKDEIYLVGGATSNSLLVVKLDRVGAVLWAKSLSDQPLSFSDACLNSENKIMISAIKNPVTTNSTQLFCLLDTDGNLVKAQDFKLSFGSFYGMYGGVGAHDDGFIFTGTGPQDSLGLISTWITKHDKNGILLWSKLYVPAENNKKALGLYAIIPQKLTGGNYAILGRYGNDRNANNLNPSEMNGLYLEVDEIGSIVRSAKIVGPSFTTTTGVTKIRDSYYFSSTENYSFNADAIQFSKFDHNFQYEGGIKIVGKFVDLKLIEKNEYFVFGAIKQNAPQGYILKLINSNSNFDQFCNSEKLDQVFVPVPVKERSHTISENSGIIINNIDIDILEVSCHITSIVQCLGFNSQLVSLVQDQTQARLMGFDTLICSKDTIINLLPFGMPNGGKFYLNGKEVLDINPSTLIKGVNYTLKYVIMGQSCSGVDSVIFKVGSQLMGDIFINNGCLNEPLTVNSNFTNSNNQYLWDFDGGEVVSGVGFGPYSIRYRTVGTKKINLIVKASVCGEINLKKTLVVSELKLTGAKDTSITLGSFTKLFVNSLGANPIDVKWTPATGLSCNNCSDPIATPKRTTKYKATVIDLVTGCESDYCVTIRVGCCK